MGRKFGYRLGETNVNRIHFGDSVSTAALLPRRESGEWLVSRFDESPVEGEMNVWWAYELGAGLGLISLIFLIYVVRCQFLKWENKSKSRVLG
jgi:hypothetical protein